MEQKRPDQKDATRTRTIQRVAATKIGIRKFFK